MEKTEIRSLLEFQFVSNPGFSPDGRLAAYVVQHAEEEENRYKGDLYILDVDRQETYRLTTHGDAYSYVWTASGTLLFSAKREEADKKSEDPISVFYEIDPRGGESRRAFSLPVKERLSRELMGNGM